MGREETRQHDIANDTDNETYTGMSLHYENLLFKAINHFENNSIAKK